MGRLRKKNHHLPHRVYIHHGAYWYMPKPGEGRPVRIAALGEAGVHEVAARRIEIPKFSFDQHTTELFRVIKRSASTRKIPLELTKADVQQMLKDANYCCTLTGIPFSYERIPGVRVRPWIPSVDRIENSKGYTVANCRLVCAYVNIALNVFGLEAFEKVMRHMRSHRSPKREKKYLPGGIFSDESVRSDDQLSA